MHPSRTPVDWLIIFVNIPAILLGLAVGWLWIIDAAQHSDAADNRYRLGLAIGFIMAYLAWNSVVMIYLILRRPPPSTATGEKLKIKRSTLRAALAQSQFSRDAESSERSASEPPVAPQPSRGAESPAPSAPEPPTAIPVMDSDEPPATPWSGEVPPIRRESSPPADDASP